MDNQEGAEAGGRGSTAWTAPSRPPGLVGASDLMGKLGSFIFSALTVRVPLVLTAGAKTCHEVPRGETGLRHRTKKELCVWGGGRQ